MKNISLYVENGSYLTKVHPFTKLLYTAAAIAIPLILGRLLAFPAMIVVSLLILALNRLLRKAVPLLVFSFTIILVVFLVQGLFYYRNQVPLFRIGPLQFYREGVFYALRICGNIFNMLLSFAVFILSTKPEDFVEELEKRGMSPKAGYIVNSVFQIIPQMMGTSGMITDAQRSRGMETEGSLMTRAKAFIPLISPVVMSSLINTRERAMALEIRGFGHVGKKSYIRSWKKHPGDRIIGILLIGLVFLSVLTRLFVL